MPRRSVLRCALVLLLATAVALPLLFAQPPQAKRYAVLVGINQYKHAKLPALQFAKADVNDLADVLRQAGYEVTLLTGSATDEDHQPMKANIEKQVHAVLRKCQAGDTALLAFTGHGLQFDGKDDCFFCPLDARPFKDETDSLVSLGKVYAELDRSFAGMKVLLVDACRDDPDASRGARRGINADSAPRPPQGVAALFSCRAGERAYESEKVRHGVFFHHVLEGLKGEAKDRDDEVTFAGLAAYVQKQVPRSMPKLVGGGARQSPNLKADYSTEPVLLTLKVAGKVMSLDLGGGVKVEFVRIPKGRFWMGSPPDEKGREDEEQQHEVEITRDFYLGRYEVTRGQFRAFVEDDNYKTEAETDGLGGWGYDEAAGKFTGPTFDGATGKRSGGETTDYSWRKTGFAQTDEHPVVNVTWNDAQAFCRWLARKTGKAVRLPTEAEWEYACRAGSTSRYYSGDDEETLAQVGNVGDGTAKKKFSDWSWAITAEDGYVFTAPVGRFRPNKFELCDMHGNVWEWCQDRYGKDCSVNSPVRDPEGPDSGVARVLRGGSCGSKPDYCRSADRNGHAPVDRHLCLGFRVAFRLD